MRFLNTALLLSALCAVSLARPARADEPGNGRAPARPAPVAPPRSVKLELFPPAGSQWLWATPRANVASLGPVGSLSLHPKLWSSGGAQRPLRVSGGVVLGLGLLALFGAGVSGIVAAAEAASLDSECPNKLCYEDSIGGRSLERARGAALAADWLVGIGAPVTASGTVMMLYSAVVERYGRLPSSPVFRASPGGGGLMFHF